MVPVFPNFKNIELSDRPTIEALTKDFSNNSHFNFATLWAWDIHGKTSFSTLNGNLVLYNWTGPQGFYHLSFCGKRKVRETAKTLLSFCKENDITPVLRPVPEEIAQTLNTCELSVSEDRDNFDYIYDISTLRSLPGNGFARTRNYVNALRRNSMSIAFAPITALQVDDGLKVLLQEWSSAKHNAHISGADDNNVLSRLKDKQSLWTVTLTLDSKLAVFAIYELMNSDCALIHFIKGNLHVKGSYNLLLQVLAEHVATKGIKYLNYAEDMGIENLRIAKERLKPVKYLKQYSVSLKQ